MRKPWILSQFDYGYFPDGKIETIDRKISPTSAIDGYTFFYDHHNQLKTATLELSSNSSILRDFAFDYDTGGNLTRATRTVAPASAHITDFTPNSRNQVVTADGARRQLIQGYTQEPAKVILNGEEADTSYHNQFSAMLDSAPGSNTVSLTATDLSANANTTTESWDYTLPASQAFSYDDNGNLLNDGQRTYKWDAANRLASIKCGVDIWSFAYDGKNRRIKEWKNGKLLHTWLWSGQTLCEQRHPDGSVKRTYLAHGEQRSGGWDAGDYFHTIDHLGSVRNVTDSNGSEVASYDYDPYGHRRKVSGNNLGYTSDQGFTGHHTHAATGLVLTLYRAYNPQTGRWLSPDPLGESEGTNLYAYVANNPISYRDPHGLFLADALLMIPGMESLLASAPDVPQGAVDFSAGMGDHISFGATDKVRDLMGTNEGVDKCSGSYKNGTKAGIALDVLATGGSLALSKSAARATASQLARDRTALRSALGLGKGAKDAAGRTLYAHHRNPLLGHPGGTSTFFPSAGLPGFLKNSALNGKALHRAAHNAAHRHLRRVEAVARGLGYGSVAAGAIRTALSGFRASGSDCD